MKTKIGAIRIGTIVVVKDRIGMVTYKKDNSNIGINFSHLSMALSETQDFNKVKEKLYALGADDVFEKSEIEKVMTFDELISIYKNKKQSQLF